MISNGRWKRKKNNNNNNHRYYNLSYIPRSIIPVRNSRFVPNRCPRARFHTRFYIHTDIYYATSSNGFCIVNTESAQQIPIYYTDRYIITYNNCYCYCCLVEKKSNAARYHQLFFFCQLPNGYVNCFFSF